MSLIPKKGTVYVVDDDEAVRDSLQWLLEGKDYRVKCFDSAESFLSRFDPREVACLIADIRMEGMSGLELQDRLTVFGGMRWFEFELIDEIDGNDERTLQEELFAGLAWKF